MKDIIKIKGAREHNLKNIDIEIPRDELVVFTGLSGSGKSSLAFDTIYAEGQRRYVESLSSYARQFLGQMDKPDVDYIDGLSPAISIDQKTTSQNPRSTVGTVTEIYDYMRLLWARIGTPHCPKCGKEIHQQTIDQIIDRLMALPEKTRVQLLAPVIRGKKGEHSRVFEDARRQGYVRVRVDGEVHDLSEEFKLAKTKKHSIEIVVDRVVIRPDARGRITDVMLDRLKLDENRIAGMANGIRDTVRLPDHTGRVLSEVVRPNGIVIDKVQVPLGLVAIIYESRPNVTSDAAALAVKSGNVCVLRSGREAYRTAKAIVQALKQGIAAAGGDAEIINIVDDTSHQSAADLMRANGLVDLLIPRGGAGLIRRCVENATVPCIQTGTGICHVYVDQYADLQKALAIIVNAKTSRPSVCNAEEVCLVHQAVAEEFLPMLKQALVDNRQTAGAVPVELRLDQRAAAIIPGTPASETDFDTEFLDYILAVGVVDSVDEAVAHVLRHSTGHSDAIITENAENAQKFVDGTDSAAVYVNVSTRFTDGGEFGLGCEMGISTQKLHARGPMGLDELCTYKYIIRGSGQTR